MDMLRAACNTYNLLRQEVRRNPASGSVTVSVSILSLQSHTLKALGKTYVKSDNNVITFYFLDYVTR